VTKRQYVRPNRVGQRAHDELQAFQVNRERAEAEFALKGLATMGCWSRPRIFGKDSDHRYGRRLDLFVLALDEPPLNVLGLPGPHYEVAGDGVKTAEKRVRREPPAAVR